ncbi:NAD(P)H-hydrate epimerase [Coemansia aciculifera]|uniref:NAD(P)H-hydrate epimerase n=1 Tax=Coemansia aciculifera TaxID=417176 RepID=A0ACC1M9S7_9FUNG|nr:NAD(P)H-hydrate epimerase [Coemansia aciculifera]
MAQSIDVELMAKHGYTIEQLMELAGLSVAASIASEYPKGKVVLCIGPGNNGGDGLVAARHLSHFGYQPRLYYPVQPAKDLYRRLLLQCQAHGIAMVADLATEVKACDVVVDAIFGFSFKGAVRAPFDEALATLRAVDKPIVSVDVPSGWDVELGNTLGVGLSPDMLVSLTVPKLCAKLFAGRFHYLGGRFAPPDMAKELAIPQYPDSSQCVRLL